MTPTGPTPAEQHLGDRLAALVDGELKHDARERVLAHLATCARCKAEADAQRRVKSVFAQTAPPSPSEGFLARLQGLPGGTGADDGFPRGPFGPDGRPVDDYRLPGGPSGGPGGRRTEKVPSPLDGFGYLPTAHGAGSVLPGGAGGFRIHEVAREADRSPWRARRFAFAAASAVSLAAIALGGAIPVDDAFDAPLRAEGAGSARTPLDADERAASGIASASRGSSQGGALSVEDRSGITSTSTFAASSAPVGLTTTTSPGLSGTGTETLLGAGQEHTQPTRKVSLASLICPSTASPLLAPLFPAAAAQPRVTASATVAAPSPSAPAPSAASSAAPSASATPLSALPSAQQALR
ncbi:zf-HC2 domain-containing protein [Streptomyces sp. NPDC001493]